MLLLDFFYLLRHAGISISASEWLDFLKAWSLNIAQCELSQLYMILRCTLIKKESQYDLFDQCFASFFQDLNQSSLDQLKQELDEWLKNPITPIDLSSLEEMKINDLDDLKKKFEQRLKEQKERHDGGNHWIGTGGKSAFGHSGKNSNGMRVGGESKNRSAVKVAEQRRFVEYRHDLKLDIRQISSVLRRLRILSRTANEWVLDIDQTIKQTAKNDGELEVILQKPKESQLHLLLLMDIGGTMDPFSQLVEQLFSAAHQATHFKSFQAYYFHNCIYDAVYEDADFTKPISYDTLLLGQESHTRMVIVGDACMNPYELWSNVGRISSWEALSKSGKEWLLGLKERFPKSIWLNPLDQREWAHLTIKEISQIFQMFPLTIEGLEKGIQSLQKS